LLNTTHTLAALVIARTGFNRWVPNAAWTAAIASNLPDIDILTTFVSAPAYIEYHRGITHTLIGVPALSLALAAVMHMISGNFLRQFLLALIVMATHPLLDFANTYGIRPFVPFAETWFYGDTLFVIDPFLDILLLAGLVATYSSARSKAENPHPALRATLSRRERESAARAALILAAAYLVVRVVARDTARTRLAEFVQQVPGYEQSAVSPRMLTPHVFTGIVEASDEVFLVELNIFRGVTGELVRMRKAPASGVLAQAETSRVGTVFRRFARFPVSRVDEVESGYRVTFVDLRYYQPETGTGFAGTVLLDRTLRVVSESLGFNQPVD
jgi:inner membrane protein